MLFYYVLKELQSRLFETADALEPVDSAENIADFQKNLYYDELYKIYSAAVAEKKSKQIWNAEIIKIIRSEDSGHNFFWNIFTEQEILPEVYNGKVNV